MAGKNEVTLTFAGDSTKLEQAFGRVGAAARSMEGDVKTAGAGFDRVGEAADNIDTKAMGFRDTLTGLQDGFRGLGQATKGDFGLETLLLLGFGVGDLASGMFNFLIPSMKSAVLWLGNTKVGMAAAAVWSKIWAGAQWLVNTALLANPIVLIVAGIVLLVAAIVLIATKTTWFQTIWRVAWTHVKAWALAFWDWLKGLPAAVGSVFAKIAGVVTAPWRAAFNAIARLWNSTIGKLSFSVPDWVPGLGGKGFSMPHIPEFHSGGVVPGPPGAEVLALLQAGERVTPAGGGGATTVHLVIEGTGILKGLRREIRVAGGDVQLVLGS